MSTKPFILPRTSFKVFTKQEGLVFIFAQQHKEKLTVEVGDIYTFFSYQEKDYEELVKLKEPLDQVYYDASEELANYEVGYICYTRAGLITRKEWKNCIASTHKDFKDPYQPVVVLGLTKWEPNVKELKNVKKV